MSIHNKQIAAIKLAIESLKKERRAHFAAGGHAYRNGMRTDVIDSEGVTGVGFSFAEDGHASYTQYTDAIQELEDLIEVLTDPGVTRDQERLFE